METRLLVSIFFSTFIIVGTAFVRPGMHDDGDGVDKTGKTETNTPDFIKELRKLVQPPIMVHFKLNY